MHDAKSSLSRLAKQAAAGADIVIARKAKPVASLTRVRSMPLAPFNSRGKFTWPKILTRFPRNLNPKCTQSIIGGDPKLSKPVQAAVVPPLSDIEQVLSEILSGATWPVPTVRPEHIAELLDLPLIHRDPFDRILIAQARREGLTPATSDSRIREYDVSTIWHLPPRYTAVECA
jgi:antitoxin (DNA-binding transcriptional repressor) of toxin-antitoxin stability system